tara:strand:+ start:62 stop:301 length:240 start_codon:yes stop_codon:yes gene_type:complete
MDKVGLTPLEYEVYQFLKVYKTARGYFPTVREVMSGRVDGHQVMREQSSTGTAHRCMCALEKKNWIKKLRNQPRAITLL